ncbi:MAG TPA: DUF1232 domain-containing protein [bacterium]|jgi:uncharacterized membrane protein YkvA (DUF1232 family)|nr:DUF1232 domain-containing protein [bacterium]HNT64661.1 DUF1232 domain-containing protein [bacterium]
MTVQSRHEDFYKKLRISIRRWAEKDGKDSRWTEFLLAAPDLFHLLVRLSLDSRVPAQQRIKLPAVIAYFILPFDFIPEAIFGPIAFTDDIALAAYVLNSLVNHIDSEILREHWAGEGDVLYLTSRILQYADQMVGKGMWQRIRNWLSRASL